MTPSLNDILENLEGTPPAYAAEVRKYAQNLALKGLPIIFSTEHFAIMIGISPKELQKILANTSFHYSTYWVKKRTGGHRLILAPNRVLKHIQTWILKNILEKVELSECANGFVPNKSIYTNAIAHQAKDVVLNIDLYRFFDTITVKRVFGIIKALGYIENLAYDLASLLCTKPPKLYWDKIFAENIIKLSFDEAGTIILPQGSPASPSISNILCKKLDKKLYALAQRTGCSYTRYADDLTFSGEKQNIPSINTIKKVIEQEGLLINEKKVKYISKNKRQLVTGIVVNNGIRILRSKKRAIQSQLHFCLKYGVRNHLEYLEKKGFKRKSNYKQWLLGHICFIHSIEKDTGIKMFKQFNSINWDL